MGLLGLRRMTKPTTVDEYLAALPDDVRPVVEGVRDAIRAALPGAEERIRYDMPAVMLDARSAIHFAGWKSHVGLYPVVTLPEPLEVEVAPYRTHKDSVRFPYRQPVPYDLVGRIAAALAEIARARAATG